jgi:hypothetical protein
VPAEVEPIARLSVRLVRYDVAPPSVKSDEPPPNPNVDVATHVGTPLTTDKTSPVLPIVRLARVLAPE